MVVRDFDRARAAARAADAVLARGERRPLLGLPMTVKESFHVAGLPTSWGNPAYAGWRPDFDSLAVARLKAAGAVILGKTNVAFMLGDWQSLNPVYGVTGNPWDLGRTAGGSSGGAAAALAAGMVPLELGSDLGGSLRAPAHYCGVFAHKPTWDLVPQRGAGPPTLPATAGRVDFAVIGPMARSAGDLALALDVLAGPDEAAEGIGYRLDLPPARFQRLSEVRVLAVDTHPLVPTASAVRAAFQGFVDRLAAAGAQVSRDAARLPDMAKTARIYVALLSAFLAAQLPPDAYERVRAQAADLAPDDESLTAHSRRGRVFSHRDWTQASRVRDHLSRLWRALFDQVDIVLMPAMPTPAFPHDHTPQGQPRWIEIDGAAHPYFDQIVWAAPATLAGLPATAIPVGRSPEGLPIGVQAVGPYLEDRTPLAFAALVEREFGGFVPPG